MGVQGLWQLLNTVGRPVTLESLENKVLAVDVSIWLHQAVQGCRNPSGAPAQNAYLLTLFKRICKLLFYKIRPIFVFDGGVPLLKKQTVAARRHRKELATKESHRMLHKLLVNAIKRDAVKQKLNSGLREENQHSTMDEILAIRDSTKQTDVFQLADLPTETQIEFGKINEESSDEDSARDIFQRYLNNQYQDVDSVDINSEAFKNMPLDIQHEILSELKESRKRNSWAEMDKMPKESQSFSSFQMARLIKKRSYQQKLEDVEKQMKNAEIDYCQEDVDSELAVISNRILSEEGAHYILTKNKNNQLVSVPSKTIACPPKETEERIENVSHARMSVDFDDIVSSSSNDSVEIFQRVMESHSKKSSKENDKCSLHLNSLREEMPTFSFVRSSKTNVEVLNVSPESLPADDSNPIVNITSDDASSTNEGNELFVRSNGATNFSSEIEETPEEPTGNIFRPIVEHYSQPGTSTESEKEINEFTQIISSASQMSDVNDEDTSNDSDFIDVASLADFYSDSSVQKMDDSIDESKPMDEDKTQVDHTSVDMELNTHEDEMKIDDVEKLRELEKSLDAEKQNIEKEMAKVDKVARSLTDQTYGECQELLKLFGIPYIVSPMEAEAQCAKLDLLDLTQGTITDDSDVWLFGGERVYRNFFNQSKFVEFFKATDIKQYFNLDRLKLVCLALMTGSDYTDGIDGVGCVTAMEILSEFPEEGLECLRAFKKWWEENRNEKPSADTPVKKKLRKLIIPPGFPNDTIVKAYLDPAVDDSNESFSWATPDLSALREYAQFRFGWSRTKSDGLLLPVLKKLKSKETQTRLDSYFQISLKKASPPLTSKRLLRAIKKVAKRNSPEEEEDKKQKAVEILRRKMRNAVGTSLAAGTKKTKKRKTRLNDSKGKKPKRILYSPNLSEDSSD